MTVTIDENDPCAAATALRSILHRAMVDGRAQEIEFTAGNGSARRVRKELVSIADLKAEIARFDNACKLATAGRPSRFGLRAGGM